MAVGRTSRSPYIWTTVTASSVTPSLQQVGFKPPASRQSPIVAGAQASRATECVIIRYRRYGLLSATEAEQRSFRSIAGACWHHGLTVVDHLMVVATGEYNSTFLGTP